MATRTLHVHAEWDHEAEVWVATSEDVPGLATEAPDLEGLRKKLAVLIPELLEENGQWDPKDHGREIPYDLIGHSRETIEFPAP